MTKKEWENCNTCRMTYEQAERLVERFKQEKKIRIATADRCVMCGEIIPEGQQVCGICKHKTELEETINCKHYVPPWNVCIMKRAQRIEEDETLEPEESEG